MSKKIETLYNGKMLSPEEIVSIITETNNIQELRLASMAYHPDQGLSRNVQNQMIHLSQAGVPVALQCDAAFAEYFAPQGDFQPWLSSIIFGRQKIKNLIAERNKIFAELIDSGVQVNVKGKSKKRKMLPQLDIDHRKMIYLKTDYYAFCIIMGFNINFQLDEGVIDSGICFTDASVVNWLLLQLDTNHYCLPEKKIFDEGISIVSRELGKDGNELAEEEIVAAINNAQESVVLISQFLPDGVIMDTILKALERGIDFTLVSNSPFYTSQPAYYLQRKFGTKKLKKIKSKFKNFHFKTHQDESQMIHAKGMIIDQRIPENSRILTGTDCMSYQLINQLGSRELICSIANNDIVNNYVEFISRNLLNFCVDFDFDRI